MNTRKYVKALSLMALLLLSSLSTADVIRYSFIDVEFADGGTLTGFFDWDTSLSNVTDEYVGSSINYEFSVAGGDEMTIPPFVYSDENAGEIQSGGTISGIRILQFGGTSSPIERLVTMIPDSDIAILGENLTIPLLISPGNSIEIFAVGDAFEVRNMVSGSLQGEVISSAPVTVTTISVWALILLAFLAMSIAALHLRSS